MQTQWYADKRDLVKWGALVHLCRTGNLKTIVQIPFKQENEIFHNAYTLSVDDDATAFPAKVWEHFRNLDHIQALAKPTNLTIHVVCDEFCHENRERYLEKIRVVLAKMNGQPKVVFLDPDTGIEPQKAKAKHVRIDEVKAIWKWLRPGDWLMLYLHALRNIGWEKSQMKRFRTACDNSKVVTVHSKEIAHDVVFFA